MIPVERVSSSHSIHRRLLALAGVVALPFLGLTGYGIYDHFRAERDHALGELASIQALNRQFLDNYFTELRFKLERLAADPRIRDLDPDKAEPLLRDYALLHDDIAFLRLLNADGRILATSTPLDPAIRRQLESLPAYTRAVASDRFTISSYYLSPGTGQHRCLVSFPVRDRAGHRVGTLALPLNLAALSRDLPLPPNSRGIAVGVVDTDGYIVLRQPEHEVYIGRRATGFEILQRHFASADGGVIRTLSHGGVPRLSYAGRISGTPWLSVAAVNEDDILAGARALLWRTSLAAALVLVLGIVIARRQARAIARPVDALAAAARDQTAGQSERLAPVSGPEEVAETARAFNEMVIARRTAEEQLALSEQRYRTVIDQTGQIVYDLDLVSGTIQWFGTEAVPAITGYSLAEFQSVDVKRWEEMIHPNDRAEAIALLDQSIATGSRYIAEYRFRHKDGSYRHVEDAGLFLHNPAGRSVRMLGRMGDITERRRAEDERRQLEQKVLETQKLESLGVLAGGIAHDFNNLLTGILGNAGLARLDAPPGWRGSDHLQQIEQAAHRAADLCKQMLAYSGKGRFVIQRLSLNELVEETAQLLHLSVSRKATLQFALAPELPAIQADATQLRQVVMNLVINASEALGDRPGRITLSTGIMQADAAYLATTHLAAELAPGSYVTLEVSDTGCGMDRATLARIFDPFFTTKFTGRGLGLAAVLGIVRGHQGAMKVYSEPGRGTTFRVLFPAVGGEVQPLHKPASADGGWRGQGRILIIDDEPAVREVARSVLELLGFTVETAADGADGLAAFQRDPARFTAVLLDLTMPHLDGEETFRQLRLIWPGVRVVLMSGFNRVEAVNRFIGKGLAGFVQKPFDIETLAQELRRVVETPPA